MRDGQHRRIRRLVQCRRGPALATFETSGARAQFDAPQVPEQEIGFASGLSGHQKDFLGVRILDLGPWRKTADVDVTRIWRVRTGDESRLIWNWNPVRQVALGRFVDGCGGRLRRRFRRGCFGWRRAGVRIVRLRRRRILRGRSRVFGWPLTRRMDWRLILASGKESKGTEKQKRMRKFHK